MSGSILIPSEAEGGVDVKAARSAFEIRHVSKLLSLPGVSSLPENKEKLSYHPKMNIFAFPIHKNKN